VSDSKITSIEVYEDSDHSSSDRSLDSISHGSDLVEDETLEVIDESSQSSAESVRTTYGASNGSCSSGSDIVSEEEVSESSTSDGQYKPIVLFISDADFFCFFRRQCGRHYLSA
jgi:hypothetical protein